MKNINEFLEMKNNLIYQAIDATNHLMDDDVPLSTNIEQVQIIDEAIGRLNIMYLKELIDDTVAWNISISYGALLGDMIINEEGGHWVINDEEIPAIVVDGGCQLSPITKIYKMIICDDEDLGEGTPSSYYDGYLALKQYMQMSEEEREAITETIEVEDN